MNWELQRERVAALYSEFTITEIPSLIERDCQCSRIDERIQVDEVLCNGCSSMLRLQRDNCASIALEVESYPDEVGEIKKVNLFPESGVTTYSVENPLLQKLIVASVFERMTGLRTNVEGVYECNNTTFLKERKYTPLTEMQGLKVKDVLISLTNIFNDLNKNEAELFLPEPSVDSLIYIDDELTLLIPERASITQTLSFSEEPDPDTGHYELEPVGHVRSYYSPGKFNIFNTPLFPKEEEMEIEVPTGCGTYLSRECSLSIKSRKVSAPGFVISDPALLFSQKELGYPIGCLSIVVYSILLGIYTLKDFRRGIEENKVLSKVWNGLFDISEVDSVKQRLNVLTTVGSHSHSSILAILKTIKLRSDVVEYLVSKFMQ